MIRRILQCCRYGYKHFGQWEKQSTIYMYRIVNRTPPWQVLFRVILYVPGRVWCGRFVDPNFLISSVVQQQQFGSMMMMMVVCWMMFWRPMRETILERWFHSRSLHCFVPPARSRTGFCLDGNAITGFYIVTHFV